MPTDDRPTIVLLPGMDGTRVLYGPLVRALEAVADVHVVEYPTDGPCDYHAALRCANDAVARLDDCHVVGWSFSGPVALRVARAQPDRVRSVTLVATFVQAPMPWLRYVGPLLVTPLVGVARTIRRLPIWLGRSPDDPLRRDKAEIWQRVRARTLAARSRAIRLVDARPDLEAVTQPIQYLVSSHDRVVPPHNLAQIRSLRADVEVVSIDGNHFALYANAQAGADAILAFARRHPAAGPC
jgi:pimeloyl-ACP methyl ester carboxylesterase